MQQILQLGIILSAGLAVAIGDVLIKRVGTTAVNFAAALFHPLMAAALALYGIQIVLFAYVFARRWELGAVAILQMGFYAAACLLVGRFFFGEQITLHQSLGMLLTFCGAVLMNTSRC